MGAAKDYVNKKWIDWVLGLLVTMIAVFTTIKTEVFGTYATRTYVDSQIILVERDMQHMKLIHQIEMKNIYDLLQRVEESSIRIENRLNNTYPYQIGKP